MSSKKDFILKDLIPTFDMEKGKDRKFIIKTHNKIILCELDMPFIMIADGKRDKTTIDIKVLESN